MIDKERKTENEKVQWMNKLAIQVENFGDTNLSWKFTLRTRMDLNVGDTKLQTLQGISTSPRRS